MWAAQLTLEIVVCLQGVFVNTQGAASLNSTGQIDSAGPQAVYLASRTSADADSMAMSETQPLRPPDPICGTASFNRNFSGWNRQLRKPKRSTE